MKYLIIALMLPTAPMAQLSERDIKICSKDGEVAEGIMQIRQMGMPQTELLEKLEYPEGWVQTIISAAYKQPRWETEFFQTRAVEDFRDATENKCLESYQ